MSENSKRFFDEFEYPGMEDWKEAAINALKGAPFEKVMFTSTYEGITLKPIYNKEDLEAINFLNQDYPGQYPFNRGGNSGGYKSKTWEISQNIPYPLPSDFNSAIIQDILNGQNSVRMNIEKSTAIHEDFTSDDISGYELLISNKNDMQEALKDIELSKIPVNIDSGVAGLPVFATLCAIAKEQNLLDKLTGSIYFDFVTELAKEGILYDNLSRFINELYAITSFANTEVKQFKTIGIKAFEWHNAGANAVQESAIAISLGVFYAKSLIHCGLSIDEIAPRMSFSFAIGSNFFMEIAKFRALRVIWSKIIKEFGGNEESQKMHIHAITSERETTKLDPYVNLLRSSSQVFSAVTGNCDSITVNNFDKEFGLPNDFSRRISRNTQNVIKYESHLDDTIDPAAGSYYIESLTNELINSIWKEFLDIDNQGGIISEIENGSIQNRLNSNFAKRVENLELRKDIIVGVNKYSNINEKPINHTLSPDRDKIDEYVSQYEDFLKSRDVTEIDSILDNFEIHFENTPVSAINLAIDAINLGAGLAELYNSVPTPETKVIGIEPIQLRRSSEMFENFREHAFDFIDKNGKNPELDFVCFGNIRDWKARADFANDFFAVGAFKNNIIDGNTTPDDAISKLDFTSQRFIVVCSTDEIYSQILSDFVQKVKTLNSDSMIILAGYPKDMIETYKSAGVDMFIHVKANIVDCLTELYRNYGLMN